jgi:mRNA interferase RelE/StbE
LAWTISYTETAKDQLRKLDKQMARRIVDYMDARIATAANPRDAGKALNGALGELWRFRVGDCRIICEIQDRKLNVLVVKIGHRKQVYR